MAATTDPNAVFYSYRGVGTNTVVQKFIALLDEKGIPHRGSESEPIDGSLTNFEEEIGSANITVIFYSQEYFESEHCMNEYACILKNETKACKEATYYVKCGQYDINELIGFWGKRKAQLENKQFALTAIERCTLANGCYIDKTSSYCVQNLDTYFSDKARYKEDSLQTLVNKIADKYHELSGKTESVKQSNTPSAAPSFKFPMSQTKLVARDSFVEKLHDLVSNNNFSNLYGFGGSGKTSLTYLFLDKYRSEYNQVAYVVVNKNVKNDFVSQINDTINIFKSEENGKIDFKKSQDISIDTEKDSDKTDRYKSIIDYLESNYKSEKNNLLIIDINNADDASKFGEYLMNNTLFSTKIYPDGWKYLILSRTNIYKGLAKLNLNESEESNTPFLKELFLKNAGNKYNDFTDDNYAKLFETIFYNPLMAEQLGIFLQDLPKKSLSEINDILHKDSFKNEKRSGITAQNRGEEEKTIIGFLKNLIVFDKLSAGEKILLKHFILWPTDYIPKDVIWQLLSKTFRSEKNRFTKLWSIVKRHFTTDDYVRESNIFFTISKILFGVLLVVVTIYVAFFKDTPMFKSLFFAVIGVLYVVLFFLPVGKRIVKSLLSKSYTNNFDHNSFDNLLSGLLKRGIISESEYNSYKLHGFIAQSLREQIVIQNTDYYDYLDEIKEKSNYTEEAFSPFAKCIGHSLGVCKIGVDVNTLFNIAIRLHTSSTSNYAALLYEDLIENAAVWNLKKKFLAAVHNNLAVLQADNLEKYNSAKSNYEKAIEIREQLPKNDPEYQNDLASAYNNLANLQKDHLGEYDSAKANYAKAISIREQLPKDNPEYQNGLARIYRNLAILQENRLGDYASAKSNYEKAIEIREQLPKDNPEYQNYLASAYNNLADLQDDHLGDFVSAKSNYEKAIEICDLLPKDNPKYQNDLASAYNNLANLQQDHLGEYELSKSNYEKAIEILEQLPKDNATYQNDLARACNNLAVLQEIRLGDYDSAKANYEKAIAIGEQLPKDDPLYQDNFALWCSNLADLQKVHLGDYDSAKENYEKAIAIQEQLPKDKPEYQNGLASAYNNLAYLQQNHLGEYELSKSNYEKAIEIGEQLPKDNPEYQNGLANTYNNLAILQNDHLGDYDSAKANYEKAIAIRKQLPKDNPKYQKVLAGSYNELAYTYDKLKEYDKAIESINTAIYIAFQLKETESKYLIYWIGFRHSLAEIKFNNGKDLDEVKNILAEIKPLAQQCLKDNPDDELTKTVNNDIADLLSKIGN
ncbi:MAG: tetratricopeptide repeat protein [Bacteroidales bacterium]|nr:tetratricopeptide repeat protein [Bacteroidales bacterium]